MSKTVTSAEFQKAFGRYREIALAEPVSITNHGRESLVLLSAVEYQRLKRRDRVALRPWELDSEMIAALEAVEPSAEAARFNQELDE